MRKFIVLLLTVVSVCVANAQIAKVYKTVNGVSQLVYAVENSDSIVFCSSSTTDTSSEVNAEIAYWPYCKEKALCFTWDDGLKVQTPLLMEMFDRYDFKTTFFIPTYQFANNGTTYSKELRPIYSRLIEHGHEIGSHSRNNVVLTTVSLDSVDYECRQSAYEIEQFYDYKPVSFAHVSRKYNFDIDTIVLKYFFTERFGSILQYPNRRVHTVTSADTYDWLVWELEKEFMPSNDMWMVYSGHGISGESIVDSIVYEPIDSLVLDNYLKLIKNTYNDVLWVATYDNIAIYEYLRENVSIRYGADYIYVDTTVVQDVIDMYQRPNAHLTLILDGNITRILPSPAIIDMKKKRGRNYVTIDLRKSNYIFYE